MNNLTRNTIISMERRLFEMAIIGVSILASAITTKILATYYFKKVDGYVKDMCEMTTKSNEHTLSILRKLQRNPCPEE